MLISTNHLLNIVTANNQALKEVAKENKGDAKSLTSAMIKDRGVETVLKELFSDAITANKTGTTNSKLLDTLKNSAVFKDIGTPQNELKSLQNMIASEPKLAKFQAPIDKLLVDIKNMNEGTLKQQIDKSGVFLESKLSPSAVKNTLSPKLQDILLQIRGELSTSSSSAAKEALGLIDKMLTSPSPASSTPQAVSNDLKSLLNILKSLPEMKHDANTKTVANLTNSLEKMVNDGTLLESKVQNSLASATQKATFSLQIKELLTQLGSSLANSTLPKADAMIKQIQNLLKQADLFVKPDTPAQVSVKAVPNTMLNDLSALKGDIIKNPSISITAASNMVNKIDALIQGLSQNPSDPGMQNNLKGLLTQIKSILPNNQTLNTLISKLDSLMLLASTPPKADIMGLADNLKPLLENLKGSLSQMTDGTARPQEILNLANKIEAALKEGNLLNPQLGSKTPEAFLKQELSHDLKSVISQMREEIAANANMPKAAELTKHIDRLALQIDYQQLVSYASSSNYIFFPFSWDMFEEGSLSFKKLDKEKYYCEIDIKLKEFGRINMMLALYDKNKFDLSMFSKSKEFRELVKENMKNLKTALNTIGLVPVNIRLLELKEEEAQKEKENYMQYAGDDGLGINIRV